MTERHERIEELLAGYALRSLEGEDAREAEILIAEHVPSCPTCSRALTEFQDTASELALAPTPTAPPDLVLGRLRREITGAGLLRRRSVASWLGTAAAVAVIGLTAWNALLNSRLSDTVSQNHQITQAMGLISQPNSKTVRFDAGHQTDADILAAYQETDVALVGTRIPDPAPGDVYWLWLGRGGHFTPHSDFRPDSGVVILVLSFDASRYDEILITEEPAGEPPGRPSTTRRWLATIEPAAAA
jgi:hypothetical protein